MHIAFLSSEYPPLPSGGIGTSIRNLARALVAMGHRVTVIGWGPQTAFEDEGVQVRFLGHTRIPKLGWLLNRWRVAREINRLVREEGLDIVEAPDWCGMSAGLIPAESQRLKVSRSEGQGGGEHGSAGRLGDRRLPTDHGPGTTDDEPQTINIRPGTRDQGPRTVEAEEQSPERSERGGGCPSSRATHAVPVDMLHGNHPVTPGRGGLRSGLGWWGRGGLRSGLGLSGDHNGKAPNNAIPPKQSPERSERGDGDGNTDLSEPQTQCGGSCAEFTPSLSAAATFVPGSVRCTAGATIVPGSVAPPADTPPSASPIRHSAFTYCGFLVRRLGFPIACPLVIRCHGTATYFARLEQLQDEVEAKRQHAEPQDQERRTRDEGRGTKNDAPRLRVKPLVRWTEGLALRQASSIVAVSRFCAETTAELFGLQGNRSLFTAHCSLITDHRSPFTDPVSPIGVIPNGIDIRQFTPARSEDVEPHTLLYFGTLVRKKGVLDFPAIFNRVVEQVPQARLRLIGRDNPDVRTGAPSTWELMRRDFSPAALPRVEYLGVKPYAEIQNYVRRTAVCIFPSYAEAFPVSWLEAMACGKPVVAYDIGWAQEVVESGVSGWLVHPGDTAAFADAAVACLRGPQRATDIGLAARQRVQQYFAANVVARQSADWYASVCQRL